MNKSTFFTKMQNAMEGQLPGAAAHALLLPGKRPLTRDEVPEIDSYRYSAVAVICYLINDDIHVILTQRNDYNGTHGGQISFPGGKMDDTDSGIEFTARRETQEEIGLVLPESALIGPLTELFIPVSKFLVQPFVYYIEELPALLLNEREVKELITFPLSTLLEEGIVQQTNIEYATGLKLKNVPYFAIQDKIVWGATAIILSELRAILAS